MLNRVKVTDSTLRDGQEDFVLKLLGQEDLGRLASLLDRVGFYSIDCCGGATFYAALTELREDPWERLKKVRRALTHTPLQMILRGRMLVGFKPYPDEVIRKFMTRAASFGVDIFRVYDNLNDLDNLALAVATGKELRKQVEATVLISLSPHVTTDDYLDLANDLANLGADVICFNDSFGVLSPSQMATLIAAYRRYFNQPLRLHLHDNQQTAIASYLEGVSQGADMVDTTLATLSWAYAPPPVESLMFSLGGAAREPRLDLKVLGEVAEYVDALKEKCGYRERPARARDDQPGSGSLPDPIKEFIREELKRRDARDRQQVAFKDAQQVWADLGCPVLKGRILEIVGLQAVENVLRGARYDRLIPSLRDLLRGRFGRLHSPVNAELQWRALALDEAAPPAAGGEEGLQVPPGLDSNEDVLTYTLFPKEAEAFFHLRAQDAAGRPAAPTPAAAAARPLFPLAASAASAQLGLIHKGEEIRARLEGVGSIRKDKQVLFINILDHVEEIEVQVVPGPGAEQDLLITFHGDIYRIRLPRTIPQEQEYTPVLLEINGQWEEFLLKTFR